jgi:hypothetical protein
MKIFAQVTRNEDLRHGKQGYENQLLKRGYVLIEMRHREAFLF